MTTPPFDGDCYKTALHKSPIPLLLPGLGICACPSPARLTVFARVQDAPLPPHNNGVCVVDLAPPVLWCS